MKDRFNPLAELVNGQVGEVREGLSCVDDLLFQRIKSLEREMDLRFKLLSDELAWVKVDLKREIIDEVKLLLSGGEQVEERVGGSLDELSDVKCEVVRLFVGWLDTVLMLKGRIGFKDLDLLSVSLDRKRQCVLLSSGMLKLFFDVLKRRGLVLEPKDVKLILGEVGLLRYVCKGNEVRYTIPIRWKIKSGDSVVVSVYLVDLKQFYELGKGFGWNVELSEGMLSAEGKVEEGSTVPEPSDDLPF